MFGWHTLHWMFCIAVTIFLTNHYNPPPPSWPRANKYDPTQMGMTRPHSISAIIFLCSRHCHSRGDRHAHSTVVIQPLGHLVLHLSLLPRLRREVWSFVQPRGEKSGLPIFQFQPAKFCRSHSMLASQFANHNPSCRRRKESVRVCVCDGVWTHVFVCAAYDAETACILAVVTHAELYEGSFSSFPSMRRVGASARMWSSVYLFVFSEARTVILLTVCAFSPRTWWGVTRSCR